MSSDIRFADCEPAQVTSDFDLARAYYAGGYNKRSAWYKWDKGPFSPPFLLESPATGAEVNYTVYFNSFTGGTCPQTECHLQCTNQTINLVTGGTTGVSTTFCINGERPIYNFDIVFESEGDRLALPAVFDFTFEDSIGNTFTRTIQSLSGVKPMNPMVGTVTDESGATKAHIGVVLRTSAFNEITEDNLTQYIIERCDWPNRTNIRTFRGPLNNPSNSKLYTDSDIAEGQEVAYRIRFKNEFGEESLNSDWIIG